MLLRVLHESIRCIEERILSQNQAISITVLHDLYGVHVQDTRYRSKLIVTRGVT